MSGGRCRRTGIIRRGAERELDIGKQVEDKEGRIY